MTSIKPFKEHRISGKDWKSKKTSKSSFSIVSRVKSQKGFEANQAKSNALKLLKITENELKQVKKDEKVRKRIEAKERLERILINEKKAQITQIVSSKKEFFFQISNSQMTETEQLPESVETTEQEQDFDDFGDFDDFSSAPATQEPQNIHDPPSSTSSSISKILLKLQSNSLDFSLFINIPDPITNSSNIESLIQQDQETKLLIPNQIFESSSWYPLYLQLSCEANPSTTAKYRWKKSFIRNSFLHSLDVVEEKVKSISNIAVDIPLKKSRDAEFAYAKSLVDIPESQLVLMTRVELEKICADLNDMTHKIQDQAAFYLDAKEQLLMDAELHNKMIASLVQYAQQQSQQGSPKAKKGVARRR